MQRAVAEWGAIHGRFQPFHQGHFSYLLQAAERAETVVIGITNPFVQPKPVVEQTDTARHLPSNNPFTYFERSEIITSAVLSYDASMLSRIRIVPFDVNADVRLYPISIPLNVIQFVTAHEPWDVEKARRFEEAGYIVEYLPPEVSRVTATAVRALMNAGDSRWRQMVPVGASEAISRLGLDCRVSDRALREESSKA